MKKKMQNGIGLLPNCIVKFFFCIARERAGKKNCIAIVLQEKGVVGLELYCNRKIVLQTGCVV